MLLSPPVLQAPPPRAADAQAPKAPLPLAQAEDLVLMAFDEGRALPQPAVAPGDRAALAWLRANAGGGSPRNPFPAGSPHHREAEAWIAFLKAPAAEQAAGLLQVRLELAGTQLGLWRWGQAATFKGRLDPAGRRAFEDRLADSPASALRAYALRHALCFAVAERDEGRFLQLRQRYDFIEGDLFRTYQRLFSLLDGPAPVIRLHSLPDLAYRDLALSDLGASRIWMMPAADRLEALPPDVAWIIPSRHGAQDHREARLEGEAGAEARDLTARLGAAGRRAWFAASRRPFEVFGLVHFPILIELDGERRIRRILMGDAAPDRP